jgi:hypothetical protein
MQLQVVTPLSKVPIGGRVRKLNGNIVYHVRDKISVYTSDKAKRYTEIVAETGCRFLVSIEGRINATSEAKSLVWLTDLDELNRLYGED